MAKSQSPKRWPEDVRRSKRSQNNIEKNPYACFNRKPHIMDFEDKAEYIERLTNWLEWEEIHNK